jgi:probable F420-dependent oxidoreductase
MQIGVVFPQTESGSDSAAIRDYAQAVEQMGYTHILAYDHVLGADSRVRPGWKRPYSHESTFQEPFVLFGYMAAITTQIEFVTGVIILPQRQTVLVAKQAAEVDVLSRGQFRLGVGTGWNDVEYEGLNEDFHNRGIRSEEQVEVLRKLWAEESITYQGRWHKISAAGIKPLPVRRSIPIWFGGEAEAVLKRAAHLGDGWFPQSPPDDNMRELLDRLRGYIREAGRDPNTFGLEARMSLDRVSEDGWAGFIEAWKQLGATHISVNTMGLGLPSLAAHVETLRRVKTVLNTLNL